jgi:hypothetical protein
MFTVRYLGRIFQTPVGFVLESPTLHGERPEGYTETYHLRIADGAATLTCNTPRYDETTRHYVYFRSLHFTRACLAVTTFSRGIGAAVVYEKSVEPDGRVEPLIFMVPQVQAYCKSFSMPRDFNEILTLGIRNPELIYALMDLAQAITEPISVVGARALERIRTLVAGPDVRPKDAWPLLHQALRVDAAYLQFVTDHSRAPRHGQDFTHTSEINGVVIERCWNVVDRCVEFVRRNKQPLPLGEFRSLPVSQAFIMSPQTFASSARALAHAALIISSVGTRGTKIISSVAPCRLTVIGILSLLSSI